MVSFPIYSLKNNLFLLTILTTHFIQTSKFNPILAIKTTKTWQGNSRKSDLNPLPPYYDVTILAAPKSMILSWPPTTYIVPMSVFLRLSLRVFWVSSTNNPPCRRIFWTSRAGTGSRVTTWSAWRSSSSASSPSPASPPASAPWWPTCSPWGQGSRVTTCSSGRMNMSKVTS